MFISVNQCPIQIPLLSSNNYTRVRRFKSTYFSLIKSPRLNGYCEEEQGLRVRNRSMLYNSTCRRTCQVWWVRNFSWDAPVSWSVKRICRLASSIAHPGIKNRASSIFSCLSAFVANHKTALIGVNPCLNTNSRNYFQTRIYADLHRFFGWVATEGTGFTENFEYELAAFGRNLLQTRIHADSLVG